MNNIPKTQFEPKQLKRLAAQRQLYSDAKLIQAFQIIFVVLPPVLTGLAAFDLIEAVWASLSGIIFTFLLLFFDSWKRSLKEKAAKIQELFDCKVLDLEWRDLMVGSQLEIEIIEEYASKYKRKINHYNELENWYPIDVGKLPLYLGRIICQRVNCWWDSRLRQRYAKWIVGVFLAVLIVVVTCFGLSKDWTLEKFILLVVNPLTPAFILGVRQYKENINSARCLDKLKEHTEKIWNKALIGANPNEITHASRELQDEIYHHRRTNSLIFDWLYNLLKNKDEELMNKTADELVNEALESCRT